MTRSKWQQIKFIQPSVEALHPRQRLLTRISEACHAARSTWISAPAGSGKTSLAATYATAHKGPVIWFRVDAGDNDAAGFIRGLYLAAGLKPAVVEPFDDEFITMRDALDRVIAHQGGDALWVWDSCENLREDALQLRVLGDVLLNDPNAPCMLFTSRQGPPRGFRRLQVAQRLDLLDWQMLRLDPEEAKGICALLGDFDASAVTDWYRISDGWIAALILLLQDRSASVSQEHRANAELFDYLATEVIEQMDEAQRRRLMQLSIPPSIPLEVAQDMLQDKQAGIHLKQMARRWHLIEASDRNPPVYRLHPLLRQFMAEQLAQRFSDREIRRMRVGAGRSLEKHGLADDACALYHEAGDTSELSRLVLSRAETLVAEGRLQTLHDWLEKIPVSAEDPDPWLDYWKGVCLRFDEPQRGWPLLEQAFNGFRDRGDALGQYSAWLATVEAMLVYFEDLKLLRRWLDEYDALRERHPRCPDMALRLKALSLAGSMMSILTPKHPRLARLIRVAEFSVRLLPFRVPRQAAFIYLIMHYANSGQIARMHAMAKHLLPHLEETALPGPLRLFAHAMIGLHQIIAGDSEPQKILTTAIKLSDHIGGGHFKSIPRVYLIYYDIISGDLSGAEKQIVELEKVMRSGHRMEQAAHDFILAWLAFASGENGTGLEVSMLSKEMCLQLGFDFGRALNCSLRAQALAQSGDFTQARQELEELTRLTEDSGSRLLEVMLGFAQSWLALCAGQRQQAIHGLSKTLKMAQHEGIFAYPGMLRPVLTELVLLAASQGIAPDYINRLVERWNLAPAALDQRGIDWPWAVRVTTLGRFELSLRRADAPLDISSHGRPLELLAAIIACGRNPLPRSLLCDRLWPDTDADKAHHALDNLIYRLRKLIGTQSVRIRNNLISLDESQIWVDAWYLDSLADHQSTEIPNPVELSWQLRRLYRGEFLAGQDEYWVKPERERLLRCYLSIAERIIASLMDRSSYPEIVEFCEHLLSCDPINESVYLHLMKSLVQQGRHAEAQRAYQRCREALMHHLQIEPGTAIEAYARSF